MFLSWSAAFLDFAVLIPVWPCHVVLDPVVSLGPFVFFASNVFYSVLYSAFWTLFVSSTLFGWGQTFLKFPLCVDCMLPVLSLHTRVCVVVLSLPSRVPLWGAILMWHCSLWWRVIRCCTCHVVCAPSTLRRCSAVQERGMHCLPL